MAIVQPPQVGPGEDGLSDPDVLAYRLVARESPLDRAVLLELVGRPKRYAELKPLLGDKGDNNLTVALKRLQEWGLIERRTDARQEPAVHTYELTPLGIQVVLAIPAIQPIHESVKRFEVARLNSALAYHLEAGQDAETRPRPQSKVGSALTQTVASALAEYLSRVEGASSDEAKADRARSEPKLEEYVEKKSRRRGTRT